MKMWTSKNQKIIERPSGVSGDLEKLLKDISWDIEITDDYGNEQTDREAQSLLYNMLGMYNFNDDGRKNLRSLKNIEKVKLLIAHAGGIPWSIFENGLNLMPMQQWIDDNSSRYQALVLDCCNTFKQMPTFRETPILYLEGICGTPGLYKHKKISKPNKLLALYHNIINACKKHEYWGGEVVYHLGKKI